MSAQRLPDKLLLLPVVKTVQLLGRLESLLSLSLLCPYAFFLFRCDFWFWLLFALFILGCVVNLLKIEAELVDHLSRLPLQSEVGLGGILLNSVSNKSFLDLGG